MIVVILGELQTDKHLMAYQTDVVLDENQLGFFFVLVYVIYTKHNLYLFCAASCLEQFWLNMPQ